MARSLRSNSRWQKLHVQQIQQVNRRLRVRLNNHTETKIDYFEQKEFLSLFGLHPINHSHVSDGRTKRNTVYTEKNGSRRRITRPNDDDSNDEFEIRSQLSKTLEDDKRSEQHTQKELLARRQSLLNNMRDGIADKRKYDTLFEHDKRMNIILKITIKDLLNKMMYIRNEKPSL